jgi:hypothetical protein
MRFLTHHSFGLFQAHLTEAIELYTTWHKKIHGRIQLIYAYYIFYLNFFKKLDIQKNSFCMCASAHTISCNRVMVNFVSLAITNIRRHFYNYLCSMLPIVATNKKSTAAIYAYINTTK